MVRSALAAETREQLQKDVPKRQLVDFIGANATFLTEPYRTLPRVGVWVRKNNVFNWIWKCGEKVRERDIGCEVIWFSHLLLADMSVVLLLLRMSLGSRGKDFYKLKRVIILTRGIIIINVFACNIKSVICQHSRRDSKNHHKMSNKKQNNNLQ